MAEQSSSASIGFPTLLLVLFIGLKLGGVIAWSWWWVLSPFWIPLAIVITIGIIILVGAIIGFSVSAWWNNFRN